MEIQLRTPPHFWTRYKLQIPVSLWREIGTITTWRRLRLTRGMICRMTSKLNIWIESIKLLIRAHRERVRKCSHLQKELDLLNELVQKESRNSRQHGGVTTDKTPKMSSNNLISLPSGEIEEDKLLMRALTVEWLPTPLIWWTTLLTLSTEISAHRI